MMNALHYTELEILRLIEKFEDCTLPKEEWTHAAHLVMALVYLRKYSPEEAGNRIREGIKRYNMAVSATPGQSGGYHETITTMYIHILSCFLTLIHSHHSLEDLVQMMINHELASRDFLLRFYSKEVLFSDAARHGWVEPDRSPLRIMIRPDTLIACTTEQ